MKDKEEYVRKKNLGHEGERREDIVEQKQDIYYGCLYMQNSPAGLTGYAVQEPSQESLPVP